MSFVSFVLFVVSSCVVTPTTVSAQSYPRRGAFEAGGGALWVGGSALGVGAATETQNQTAAARLTLFKANGRLQPAVGLTGRVTINLTSTFGIEAGLTYNRPAMAATITNDFENAPAVTIEDSSLHQYFVDAGVVLHLTRLRFGDRTVPFFNASAGYLRQLAEQRVVVETGRVYQVGGGLKQLLGGERLGLRLDARLGVREGGFSLDEPRGRAFFMAGGSLFMVF